MMEIKWNRQLRQAFFYEAAHLDNGSTFTELTHATRGDGMWF